MKDPTQLIEREYIESAYVEPMPSKGTGAIAAMLASIPLSLCMWALIIHAAIAIYKAVR